VNLPLPAPELYDVINDPDESYDVAPERPEIVAQIRSRIERLIETFPDNIRQAYEQTKARKVAPTAVGNFPRV
jgi:arylsulfatase